MKILQIFLVIRRDHPFLATIYCSRRKRDSKPGHSRNYLLADPFREYIG